MHTQKKQLHQWLKSLRVSIKQGATSSYVLPEIVKKLRRAFARNGHALSEVPTDETDIVISTGEFERPIAPEDSAIFSLWRDYKLKRPPSVVTLVHLRSDEFVEATRRLEHALKKPSPSQSDYPFSGLLPDAHRILSEQGRRGGALLALARILQAQVKCVRIVLFVGDNAPSRAYHFDLVGSIACTRLHLDEMAFYDDIVHRIVTAMSTRDVTDHVPSDNALPSSIWDGLDSVQAMCTASREFNERRFFTEAVSVSDLISVPTVTHSIATQYSEGCFGTWDASLKALISTITGSAKVLNKGDLTSHDLVPIEAINDGRNGVVYRQVEGKADYPPSSEAFEMLMIDQGLPEIPCPMTRHRGSTVPVIRSKLHGHRGVKSFDPRYVEYAPIDEAYFNYPVTCGSEAQALALTEALSRAESLRNPEDPRRLAFTILPCHGIVIVEKWTKNKQPFQVIWEHMDQGIIRVEDAVPQELVRYESASNGHVTLASAHSNPTEHGLVRDEPRTAFTHRHEHLEIRKSDPGPGVE